MDLLHFLFQNETKQTITGKCLCIIVKRFAGTYFTFTYNDQAGGGGPIISNPFISVAIQTPTANVVQLFIKVLQCQNIVPSLYVTCM